MKSINDIILTNAISAYLDESIIKRIENLKDYHINECCCDCDCKCCEPCCCGTSQSFIFFNSEDEIATIKDIDNLSNKYISIEALKSALSDINDDINNIEMEEIGQALLNIKRLVNANS